MNLRYAVLLCILSVILVAGGCDLFELREPAPPNRPSFTHEPPSTAQSVLRNLRYAVTEYNVDNYMSCFADTSLRTFVFIPSSFYAVFVQWNLQSEREHFLNLGIPPANNPPTLTLAVQDSVLSADSARYSLNYQLFFPHHRSDVAKTVFGNMQLSLIRDQQGFWYVYRWEDARTLTDSTWSYLKANI